MARYLCRRAILVCALLVVPPSALAQTPRELFPNTNDLGRAVIEYKDDAIQMVAAYNSNWQATASGGETRRGSTVVGVGRRV